MDIDRIVKYLRWFPPRFITRLERLMNRIPAVQRMTEKEYDRILKGLTPPFHKYHDRFPSHVCIPETGDSKEEILASMKEMAALEESRWKDGFVSGAVYHGDSAHSDFLSRVYALFSQANPLHPGIWPSVAKFEAEIVAMTARMLSSDKCNHFAGDDACGTVTSGGTESILLAMMAYRNWTRNVKGIRKAEIVAPSTAHAAFDKAAEYFGMKLIRVPVGIDYRADVIAMKKAVSSNTAVIVGSAPAFPHGTIDPIEELSAFAQKRGIGFHTDACLGGFILPWAEKLGYIVPSFDFRLPGVTSISVDTHKYGYAAKGTSVILYRRPELRRYQYHAVSDWSGGLYISPTLAGSRPGALSAACWAAMVSVGESGYLDATKRILETASFVREKIAAIPEIRVLGDSLWVIAFTSDTVNIYEVLNEMSKKGWDLNGLHKPIAAHICITLRHTQPGVKERFVDDLVSAIAFVREHPPSHEGMVPIYGMAAKFPMRGMVKELLKRYLDSLYRTR